MPEIDPEATEFLTRFLGGTVSAATESAFVAYRQHNPDAAGQFPFNKPIDQLPAWYQIIVGGVSLGEFLLGLGLEDDPLKLLDAVYPTTKMHAQQFGKELRKFGEGAITYSLPMLTARTIVNATPWPTAAKPGASQPSPPAAGKVIKL